MSYQAIFKRYETKYLITLEQKKLLLEAMEPYMELDKYGRTTIRNIYFDTDNYRLVRRSIEKPAYKEKLRIRSYGRADSDSTVFVELKKKYDSVVYKRRISMTQEQAIKWICENEQVDFDTQIANEINYFKEFYKNLRPMVFLSYEREAFYSKDGSDFRVTFDDNILSRQEDISLAEPVWGEELLEEGMAVMEIKCSGGMPLWMTHALTRTKVYKTSFSKYGTAYQNTIYPVIREEKKYA